VLDFTALGALRIDATVRGTHLAATLRTTAAAVAQLIDAQTPGLTARLQELGFQAAVHCRAEDKVPIDVEDSFTRVLIADASRLLDVTV
jgi:Flagellar hook-length control protein FliK